MFTLIQGPMGAGKTTHLKSLVDNNKKAYELKKIDYRETIIFVNYYKDQQRYGPNVLTHTGLVDKDQIYIKTLDEIPKMQNYKTAERIFINELQMFNDTSRWILQLLKDKKIVYACGLSATADQKLWPSIVNVMPFVTDHIYLKAFCSFCVEHTATMTIKVDNCSNKDNSNTNGNTGKSDDSFNIVIGSFDIFKPICLKCFLLRSN